MMADLPGTVGWPVLGDKTVDFYRDPLKFVKKNIEQTQSHVFACRFLNKATAFVCSNRGVQQVLTDPDNALTLGYKQFMGQIYGQNILFVDGDEAYMFRDALANLFSPEASRSYHSIIKRIAETHATRIKPSTPLNLYAYFKQVVTEICLTLFLGLDFSEKAEASSAVRLTLSHWQGIVSVPLKVKIPITGNETTFSRAMNAKEELLKIIRVQRGKAPDGFVRRMQSVASVEEDNFINNHLLLFSSALVPKAISSILTMFAMHIGKEKQYVLQDKVLRDMQLRSNIFKEVLRLSPPFLGGRRITKKDVVIDGYKVPADYAIIYMTHIAQRDPKVFHNPNEFQWERWLSANISEDNLFGFGLGPRRCIGQQIVWNICNEVLTQLLLRFRWTLSSLGEMNLKQFPVHRPKGAVLVDLKPTKFGLETSNLAEQSDSLSLSSLDSSPGTSTADE